MTSMCCWNSRRCTLDLPTYGNTGTGERGNAIPDWKHSFKSLSRSPVPALRPEPTTPAWGIPRSRRFVSVVEFVRKQDERGFWQTAACQRVGDSPSLPDQDPDVPQIQQLRVGGLKLDQDPHARERHLRRGSLKHRQRAHAVGVCRRRGDERTILRDGPIAEAVAVRERCLHEAPEPRLPAQGLE